MHGVDRALDGVRLVAASLFVVGAYKSRSTRGNPWFEGFEVRNATACQRYHRPRREHERHKSARPSHSFRCCALRSTLLHCLLTAGPTNAATFFFFVSCCVRCQNFMFGVIGQKKTKKSIGEGWEADGEGCDDGGGETSRTGKIALVADFSCLLSVLFDKVIGTAISYAVGLAFQAANGDEPVGV